MSEEKEPIVSDEQALETGTQAFFAAVGEGAKVVVPAVAASAGWQAMLAVTLPLMGLAVAKGAYRLFAPRTARLAKGYTKAFGDDPTRVAEHAERHEDDADYHETMFRTFRAMVDAADSEVVETLGYMAGIYTASGKKPDKLFRGLGKILCAMEHGQLAELKRLLSATRPFHAQAKDRVLHLVWGSLSDATDMSWHVVLAGGATALSETEDDLDLFNLLKQGLLASTPLNTSGNFVFDAKRTLFPDGDRALLISVQTVKEMLDMIDPQPSAA